MVMGGAVESLLSASTVAPAVGLRIAPSGGKGRPGEKISVMREFSPVRLLQTDSCRVAAACAMLGIEQRKTAS